MKWLSNIKVNNWFKSWTLKEPGKKKKENTYRHQNLAKKRRGESFKGHAQDVFYNSECGEKGRIVSFNQYFSGSVWQTYNIDDDETVRIYNIQGKTPKWLSKKVCKMPYGANYRSIHIENNPKISIFYFNWELNYSTTHDGFNFANHHNNINELKELELLYRKLRNKIKTNSIESLLKECTICDVESNVLKLNKNYLV
jgi:hypothetical protein